MAEDTGVKAFISLGADVNKRKGEITPDTKEGIVSEKLPELTLEMSDEKIIKLAQKWEKSWNESSVKKLWEGQIKDNEDYWLGKQFERITADKDRPQVDNILFEAIETYLPTITRRNPEPLVTLHSSEKNADGSENPEHVKYLDKVKLRLADLADINKLRLKLKKVARHWAIYQLGVVKFGWSIDKDMPIIRVIRPKKMILDPEATIDEDGYTGDRIGEHRKLTASKILAIIGKSDDQVDEKGGVERKGNVGARKAVTDLVKDDLATEVQFIEWWTPEFMCWTLGKEVLLKRKNPHWNYDGIETEESVDAFGNVTPNQVETKGINHLPIPQMPFVFLSVFNLGDQPVDKTSLMGQNLANQDRINTRNKQIGKNVDNMNGGMVVSLARSGLTQGQAKGVSEALRRGGVVVIPDGEPESAIKRMPNPGLPSDVFNDLIDTRSRVRDIFGVRGSSAAGLETEQTVRGKIMNKGTDTDRTGGGVSEYLEQVSDDIYNWLVQLLYVYDSAFQFIEDVVPPKIVVSVKEGSLLPKDSTTIANQALELASIGKISNLDLFKRLEYPNAEELAANIWIEANAPHLLYKNNPLVQEVVLGQQAAAQQQTQAEAGKEDQTHQRDLQKENLKGEIKMQEGMQKSILAAVPQNQNQTKT